MNPSCPCCVCVQNKTLTIPDWFKASAEVQIPLKGEENDEFSAVKTKLEERSLPTSSFRSTDADLSSSTEALSSESDVASIPDPNSILSSSGRSFRISMDGNINQHHEPLATSWKEPSLVSSPPSTRSLYRSASIGRHNESIDRYGYDQPASSFEEERQQQHKSLSRIESMPARLPPREPRMRRRCSVTKFNLEDTFQRVQMDDRRAETSFDGVPPTTLVPPEPAPIQPEMMINKRRPRRRCSITKFNLEATTTLHQVQQREVGLPDTVSSELSPEHPSSWSPPPSPLDDLWSKKDSSRFSSPGDFKQQQGGGLAATPESKKRFKVRNPWGRAA